jgi:hypothetical protein
MARRMRRGLGARIARDEAQELRNRLAHLEGELQALQDSVYRDVRRHDQEMADLRQQLDPANLVRALSDDARRRGL